MDENESADESRQAGGPPEQAAGERGPPVEMPDPVPDFVSDIHQTIQDHLSGAVEDLGAAISDITPGGQSDGDTQMDGDGSGNESAGQAADQPTATPTPA